MHLTLAFRPALSNNDHMLTRNNPRLTLEASSADLRL